MAHYETKHGTLSINLIEVQIVGRMYELRSDTGQLETVQAKDHHVQSFIIDAGNDVEQGMRNFFLSVLRRFNEVITDTFKDSDDGFKPIEDLLKEHESHIAWNGEGFELRE